MMMRPPAPATYNGKSASPDAPVDVEERDIQALQALGWTLEVKDIEPTKPDFAIELIGNEEPKE